MKARVGYVTNSSETQCRDIHLSMDNKYDFSSQTGYESIQLVLV